MTKYMNTSGIVSSAGGSGGDFTNQLKSLTTRMNTVQIDLSSLMNTMSALQGLNGQIDQMMSTLALLEERVVALEAKHPK